MHVCMYVYNWSPVSCRSRLDRERSPARDRRSTAERRNRSQNSPQGGKYIIEMLLRGLS